MYFIRSDEEISKLSEHCVEIEGLGCVYVYHGVNSETMILAAIRHLTQRNRKSRTQGKDDNATRP